MNIFGLLLLNNNERTLSNENQNKQKSPLYFRHTDFKSKSQTYYVKSPSD